MENTRRTQVFIILGFIGISLLIIGGIALYYRYNSQTNYSEPDNKAYVDPGSGDLVLSPEGKTPETYGTNPDQPIYLGFTAFLDIGVNDEQVQYLKDMLVDYAFSQKDKEKITEISLDKSSLKHSFDPEGPSVYKFNLTINRKDILNAEATAPGIDSITLKLTPKDSQSPVFTSQKP